jgi:mannose/fructose/N-acetylgalactosamine-specific phosphotransferase system component IIC
MNWLTLMIVGGLVGLDGNSFPQMMISRPLVAGTLTGWIFGRPLEGAMLGAVLEVFALVILPIGAARYPEAGAGTVAATAAYVHVAELFLAPGVLLLAVAFGLLWEWVGSASVVGMRRVNERLVADPGVSFDARSLAYRHIVAMVLDFLRGAVVCGLGAIVGWMILRTLAPFWVLGEAPAFGVLGLSAAAAVGALLPLFGGWSQQKIAFTLGLACGSLLLLLG